MLISHARSALADRRPHLFLVPESAAALPVALPGDTVGCGGVRMLPLTSESRSQVCQFLLGPSEMDTLGVSEHVLGGWGDRKQDTPQLTHPNNQSDIRLWRG